MGTGIKVRIVAEWFSAGHTPDPMHEAWPHVALPGIYPAIAYYLDHKQAIDDEIAALQKFADQQESEETPGRRKLRDRGLRP